MKRHLLIVIVCLCVLFCIPGHGICSTLDPGAIGSRSLGMHGVAVAIPGDLLSAFFHNPAGLCVMKGTNFQAGAFYLYWPLTYKNDNGYKKTNSLRPLMPYVGTSFEVTESLVLALGAYSTLGSGTEFKKDINHGVNYDIRNQTGVLSITPAVSYRLLPQLSIGIEFIIGYGQSEIQLPLGDLCLKTKTDGFGFGASLGLLYEPDEKLSLGLSWRSPMKTPLEGDAHLNGAKDGVKLDLYWPQMLTGGIAYEITPRLKAGISLKWTDWSVLDRSKFGYDTFSFLDGHLVRDTRDGIRFQAGLEYFHRKNFVLRCGYMYDRSSIDNKWNSPIFFDSNSHQISVGFSCKIRDLWIDFAYVHAFMRDRRVPDSMTGFPGEYTSSMEIFGLDVRYCY